MNRKTWPDIVAHIAQDSGTFAKHLSKMLDQCLVVYETDAKVVSLTSVLRCRKCKFYLPTRLESVVSHAKACASPKASTQKECTVCNACHSTSSTHACSSALRTTLALHCRSLGSKSCLACSKAVIKNSMLFCENHTPSQEKFLKIGHCFATIVNAFTEHSNDSIEELIVASKQRSKSKIYQ